MKRLVTHSERHIMKIMPSKHAVEYPGFLSGAYSEFNCCLGDFDPYFLSANLGINTPYLRGSSMGETITTPPFIVLSIKQL